MPKREGAAGAVWSSASEQSRSREPVHPGAAKQAINTQSRTPYCSEMRPVYSSKNSRKRACRSLSPSLGKSTLTLRVGPLPVSDNNHPSPNTL